MSEPTTSNPEGKTSDNGKSPDPISELRQRHADAVSGRAETRGVKPGTKRGSYNKGFGSPRPPSAPPAPGPAAVVPASNESLNKKMGQVWRAVGYGLALGTNCNVWFLDAEQEKLLGEAYGDLCSAFGIADTTAFKVVFAVGTTIGVMGAKAFGYAKYQSDLAAQAEQRKKDLKGDAGKPQDKPAAPGPDAPPSPPTPITEIPKTEPGTL